MSYRLALRSLLALAVGGLALEGAAHASPITYRVNVTTPAAFVGQPGFLDFQFNPSIPPPPPVGSDAATVTIFNFITNGGGLGTFTANPFFAPNPTGPEVQGSLAPTMSIDNTQVFNAGALQYVFGSSFQFDVTLSGNALDNPVNPNLPSSFNLVLWEAGATPEVDPPTLLPGSDLSGSHLTICTSPACTGFTASFITVAVIPEPGSLALFTLGLAGLVGIRWWKRRRRAAPAV